MPEPGQQAIADYFREQARWRHEKAAGYPEDTRNLRCAEGLEELAEYVLNLPPSDQRIIELTTLGVTEGMFIPPPAFSADADRVVARFRFHHGRAEECDGFLTDFVKVVRDDALKFAREQGVLSDDDE